MKIQTIFSVLATVLCIMIAAVAYPAEVLVEATLTQDAVIAVDKNGVEYVRLIGEFSRTLNGVEYNVSLPIMAFGTTAEAAKGYAKGDTLKAICQNRKLSDGRESYSIVAFIE